MTPRPPYDPQSTLRAPRANATLSTPAPTESPCPQHPANRHDLPLHVQSHADGYDFVRKAREVGEDEEEALGEATGPPQYVRYVLPIPCMDDDNGADGQCRRLTVNPNKIRTPNEAPAIC
jgi:hypothetical protein